MLVNSVGNTNYEAHHQMSTISLVLPTLNVNIGTICQLLINFWDINFFTRLHLMLDIISYQKRAHKEWRIQIYMGMVDFR